MSKKLEYEYSFYKYDKKDVIKRIKANGGYRVHPKLVYRLKVFVTDAKDSYLRLRKENDGTKLTYKVKDSSGFDEEYEVGVDSFEDADQLITKMGYRKKYIMEKFREKWTIPGLCKEIVFDTYPAAAEYMEVECLSLDVLDKLVKKLGLTRQPKVALSDYYSKKYGISDDREKGDLTFANVCEYLLPYVTRNRQHFMERVKKQLLRQR